MALPRSMQTTSIDVLRQSEAQSYAEPDGVGNVATRQTVAAGVPAALTAPAMTSSDGSGGQRVVTSWRLYCDPVIDLRYTDVVLDRATGQAYSVDAAVRRTGLGMDYLIAAVHEVRGLSV
jgi:hypothetical protein